MSGKSSVATARNPVLSEPGLILAGLDPTQVVCNSEAIHILTYPRTPTESKRIGALMREKIETLFRQRSGADSEYAITEITSGRRHYRCTRYVLNMQGLQAPRTVVILLERTNSPDIAIQQLCNGLHLTEREREAVGLLMRGLTSKEIAQHMGISPNTVKSFLRLVMTKAGVSTRTGLIGRVAGVVPRHQTVSAASGQNGDAYQNAILNAGPGLDAGAELPRRVPSNSVAPLAPLRFPQRSQPGDSRNRVR